MITFLDARITSDKNSYALEVEVDVEETTNTKGSREKTGNIVKRWRNISYPSTLENCILAYLRHKSLEITSNEDITLNELVTRLTTIKDEIKVLIKGL